MNFLIRKFKKPNEKITWINKVVTEVKLNFVIF